MKIFLISLISICLISPVLAESYKLQKNGVIRESDKASIPNNEQNRDWIEYTAWKNAGGIPAPEFTADELQAQQDVKDKHDKLDKDKGKMKNNQLNSNQEIKEAIQLLLDIQGIEYKK